MKKIYLLILEHLLKGQDQLGILGVMEVLESAIFVLSLTQVGIQTMVIPVFSALALHH